MSTAQLPALLGGTPVRPKGPPPWPGPDADVLAALEQAYANCSWGKYHGVYVEQFEERLAAYHGVPFAATCGSGTFAVETALRALKVESGDEVVLAAYDYEGNFLSVHAVAARPVLVDVAPSNWNLEPGNLQAALGPKTRVLIVSHLHGGIVPMREVMEFAAEHDLRVIEDAAQAPGAMIQGRRAGTWGDVGILSFGGSKLLTAGRGGALLTGQADIRQRIRLTLHRGNHVCPLSELQAAVLLPQLAKLDERNALRARNVELLDGLLTDVPGLRPFANPHVETKPGYYKRGFQLDAEEFGLPRDRAVAALRAEGMAFDDGFRALHIGRSPSRLRKVGSLAEAERAHHSTVILHHPVLLGSAADIAQVVAAVNKIHDHAPRLRE
jgi:dTDP-4-amino-4,6-dideoxygalactose transaminase